jgi:hypothetical protein
VSGASPRKVSVLVTALLLAACTRTETMHPKDWFINCLRVHYDAGGHRVVVAGKTVERISDTHVIVREIKSLNGSSLDVTSDTMDISSNGIVIDEGACEF